MVHNSHVFPSNDISHKNRKCEHSCNITQMAHNFYILFRWFTINNTLNKHHMAYMSLRDHLSHIS